MSETIRVYGSTRSRAMRVLWMCRELNLEFEQVDIMPGGAEARAPDFRAKHPMGKIPVLEMPDGFVLWHAAQMVFSLFLVVAFGAQSLFGAPFLACVSTPHSIRAPELRK